MGSSSAAATRASTRTMLARALHMRLEYNTPVLRYLPEVSISMHMITSYSHHDFYIRHSRYWHLRKEVFLHLILELLSNTLQESPTRLAISRATRLLRSVIVPRLYWHCAESFLALLVHSKGIAGGDIFGRRYISLQLLSVDASDYFHLPSRAPSIHVSRDCPHISGFIAD